jgi:protein phosphatase
LKGNEIVIYRGRPGGVLWFQPTVAARTAVTTDQVESYHLQALVAGQEEPTLNSAHEFVNRLVTEKQGAQAALRPSTPTSTRPTAPGPARTTTTTAA